MVKISKCFFTLNSSYKVILKPILLEGEGNQWKQNKKEGKTYAVYTCAETEGNVSNSQIPPPTYEGNVLKTSLHK